MKRLNLFLIMIVFSILCNANTLTIYNSSYSGILGENEILMNSNDLENKAKNYTELNFIGTFKNDWNPCFEHSNNTIKVVNLSNANLDDSNWKFKNFISLEKVIFPKVSFSITESAFQDCKNLNNISIPGVLCKEIGTYAFAGCTSLKNVEIINNSNSFSNKFLIKSHAFYKSGIKEILIPSNCYGIEDFAFGECDSLKKVTFTEGMGIIKELAFEGSKYISTVQIKIDEADLNCSKVITCEKHAFDYDVLDCQTETYGKTAFMMVGDNDKAIETYETKKQHYTGNPVAINPSIQASINAYRAAANNGWQQFIWNNGQQKINSEQIPLSTFSINRPMTFEKYDQSGYPLSVYMVAIADKNGKKVVQLKLINGNKVTIKANTAVLIYSPNEFVYNPTATNNDAPTGDYTSQLIPLCNNAKNTIYYKETIKGIDYYSYFLCRASQTRYGEYWKDQHGRTDKDDYFSFFSSVSGIYPKANKGYLKLPGSLVDKTIRRIGFDLETRLKECLKTYSESQEKGELDYRGVYNGVDAGFALSKDGFTFDLNTYTEDQIISGITSVEENSKNDDYYYSLSGIRTTNPSHGIFIHNGKKVFIK